MVASRTLSGPPDAAPRPCFRVSCLAAMLLAAGLSVVSGPAQAAQRARLSADLADHLAAGSQSIDVIVHGTRGEVDILARRYNVVVTKYLKGAAVLRVTAGQLAAIADDGSQDHLSADIPIRSSADVVAEAIGADQVWAGSREAGVPGLSGTGVGVAVIDSGVDVRHAALLRRVVVSHDFTGGDGSDGFGHGTHVAALIAGAPVGEHRGIAFAAHIVNLRVLDERGWGSASAVIEAIDWAIDHRRAYNIRVINLSIGAPVLQPYRDDPLCEAVERAVAAGIVVVTAAGNGGVAGDGRPVYGSISSPANDPGAITVGALDIHDTADRSDDIVAPYSGKGPTRYDWVTKPDLLAPGSRVVSAEAAGSYLARTYSERHVSGSGPAAYLQLSGTSMSAAVVSGTVALMLEARPELTPALTKTVLQATGSATSDSHGTAGAAGLRTFLATRWLVENSKPLPNRSLIFSIRRWLRDGDNRPNGEPIEGHSIVSDGRLSRSHHAGSNQPACELAYESSACTTSNSDSIVWDVHGAPVASSTSIVWD